MLHEFNEVETPKTDDPWVARAKYFAIIIAVVAAAAFAFYLLSGARHSRLLLTGGFFGKDCSSNHGLTGCTVNVMAPASLDRVRSFAATRCSDPSNKKVIMVDLDGEDADGGLVQKRWLYQQDDAQYISIVYLVAAEDGRIIPPATVDDSHVACQP